MADYFSFEDVLGELKLSEEDLKRMVSEGELRAFRDENKMKFKKEDVENLKKGRITEPTIILPSTPGAGTIDDTVLDLDIGKETAALHDTSAPTLEIQGHAADTDMGLPMEEAQVSLDSEETFIEEDASDTGLTTEPLLTTDEPLEAATVSEEAPAQTRRGRRVTAQVPVAFDQEFEAQRAHPAWTALMVASFILTLFSAVFLYDLARQERGHADQPLGLTAGVANFVLGQFWSDPEWTKHHEGELPAGVTLPVNPNISVPKEWYTGPSFEMPDTAPTEVPVSQ